MHNKFILNTDEGIWNFIIYRVYSRDELLPLLEKCVGILGVAIDGSESKGYVKCTSSPIVWSLLVFWLALSSQPRRIKSVFTYYLICLYFRHCQELSESRDIIAGLLSQFEDLSGINSDVFVVVLT